MERPHIMMSMASSADGKVTTRERLKLRYGSDEDRRRLEERRVTADAVLIGKGELVTDDPPILLRREQMRARRHRQRGPADLHPLNAVVTSRLDFEPSRLEFFNHPETRRLVFTTPEAPLEKREELARFAALEVVPAGPDGRPDLLQMAARMSELGIRRLMLEGGGTLNAAMLAAGLVDEIFLTLCPFVFGGAEVPTPVGGPGFDKESVTCLELVSCETAVSGEVFLHYRVVRGAPVVEQPPAFKSAYRIRGPLSR